MREVIIPGTDCRYTIGEDGEMYSYYGNRKRLKKRLDKLGIATVKVRFHNKDVTYYISLLMRDAFNLTPPDSYHLYHLTTIDGDPFNNCLNNLHFRKRLNTNYPFYPETFYNFKGELIHKTCGKCGDTREIKHFPKVPSKQKGAFTYANSCYRCVPRITGKETLAPYYIAKNLRLHVSDLTPEVIRIYKKKKNLQNHLKTLS